MRLPRTQRDLSWPLGWTALALELAGILTYVYSLVFDHLGHTYNDPESSVIAGFLWLAGLGVAILTLCITPFMPTGRRGWGPALGAMVIFVGIVAYILVLLYHAE